MTRSLLIGATIVVLIVSVCFGLHSRFLAVLVSYKHLLRVPCLYLLPSSSIYWSNVFCISTQDPFQVVDTYSAGRICECDNIMLSSTLTEKEKVCLMCYSSGYRYRDRRPRGKNIKQIVYFQKLHCHRRKLWSFCLIFSLNRHILLAVEWK